MTAEIGRKQSRRKRCDHAVEIAGAGAERDQGEHVEIARLERLPAALEERPARPQHDRRRQRELNPVGQVLRDQSVPAGKMVAHLQHEDRRSQHRADPEAPRHVRKFGIGSAIGGRDFRFERHAADRAGAGAFLPDLRMHRAGIDRARRHRLGLALVGREIFFRIGGEFRPASRRTEIIGAALCSRGGAWRYADRPSSRRPDRSTPLSMRLAVIVSVMIVVLRASWSSVLRKIPLGGI